jgi:hypothetical protein
VSRCAITNSSLDRDCCLLLLIAAAVVVPAIATSVHFTIDKFGEVDDEVLVLARSEREIEKGLVVNRSHEQLAKQTRSTLALALGVVGPREGSVRTWTQILPLFSLIS